MILTTRFTNVDELEIQFKNPLAASLFNTRKKPPPNLSLIPKRGPSCQLAYYL